MRHLLCLLPFLGGMSCAAPPQGQASPGHSPLAWRLVESPAPGGPELVLGAYDPRGPLRIPIRFAQEGVSVGEIAEAEIRLTGAAGRHRIGILPDRPGVEILGPREFWTDGETAATARFPCSTPGRGGISVLVKG